LERNFFNDLEFINTHIYIRYKITSKINLLKKESSCSNIGRSEIVPWQEKLSFDLSRPLKLFHILKI